MRLSAATDGFHIDSRSDRERIIGASLREETHADGATHVAGRMAEEARSAHAPDLSLSGFSPTEAIRGID
jgi:hypothetical protein